jgi:hypothetical protein
MNIELVELIMESNGTMEGWASPEKALAMAELIEEEIPNVVVELGVFGGRSLIPQAMALRTAGSGVIIGVDPWRLAPVLEGDPSEADKDWWTNNVNLHEIHKGFMEALWKYDLSRWAIIMRGTSEEVFFAIPKKIDILHIDGNHTEVASVRDVSLYLPRVAPGGFVWFDDTDWPTTEKAVGLLDEACERVKAVGSCVLFRKKGGRK